MPRSIQFIISCSLLLAGCGAGGDGGDASTAIVGAETPANRELGSRSVPGGQVTVTALTPLAAGQEATFRIVTAGMTGITTVEVLLGTDFSDALPLVVTVDGDAWLAVTTLPDPLSAACRVLVRLIDVDGTVQETGIEDFAIAGR